MPPSPDNSSAASSPAACDWLWLLLGLGLLYFLPLGLRPLSNPDEGRYVEIAREMAVSGDWVSPRLNGVLYFEKPPLVYWLEAGAISIGGTHLWILRFWPAALALLGCIIVFLTGRALWGRPAGFLSALVLGTSLLYFAIGQIIILDMAVSVFITAALCAFLLAVRTPPGPRRRWLCWAFYASMALALLTKGLIGVVIPGAIIFLWILLLNRWRELRHAHLLSGLALLFAIALPWHITVALANPPPHGWSWPHFFTRDWDNQGFLWYYFVHEHFLRYVDPSTANRVQPWWFFSVILLAGFLPWTFFLPSALRAAGKGGWQRMKAEPEIPLLFLWALFPLLFFSTSSSKLIPYILPSVPPLALLTGRYLRLVFATPNLKLLPWPLRLLAAITFVVLLCANPLAAKLLQNRRPTTAPAADWLRPRLHDTDRVFTLWDYGPYQDFAPLLGRTVGIGGHIPDEQEFGLMLETSDLAPRYPGLADYLKVRRTPGYTAAQIQNALLPPFLEILRGPARVYVLVKTKQFTDFQTSYPAAPAHVAWRDDNFVIFSNQATP